MFIVIGDAITDHRALLLRNTGALLRADSDAPLLIPAEMYMIRFV